MKVLYFTVRCVDIYGTYHALIMDNRAQRYLNSIANDMASGEGHNKEP